jgi:predicted Zn finger-like uncharacterized protein
MQTWSVYSPPQCPTCGSTDVVHDELITGERSLRCRECGHEWTQTAARPESAGEDSGELVP